MAPGQPPGKSRPYPAGNGKVWLAAGSLAAPLRARHARHLTTLQNNA